MQKTKTLALAAALTVLAIALIGIAYAQTIGAQTTSPSSVYGRTPQTTSPQQPYDGYYCPGSGYGYDTPQTVAPYQPRNGFGGFCR
jgi:hypothetical protein